MKVQGSKAMDTSNDSTTKGEIHVTYLIKAHFRATVQVFLVVPKSPDNNEF